MWRSVIAAIGISGVLWTTVPSAHGQKATEIYIPLGQSPGLSEKITVIGRIERIDAGRRLITVAGPSGTWIAQITGTTRIWLDTSHLRLPNRSGTLADLEAGQLVEVKYLDPERREQGPAEWVKVQWGEAGSNPSEPGR